MHSAEIEALIRRYAAGPSLLRAAWSSAPAESRRWRPGPGKWSAHEVVVHCADSETNAHGRLRYLLCESEPLLVGYDQDVWARRLDYQAHPVDAAFATVDAVRANTVPLLLRLSPDDWAKRGRHTEVGEYSVERWLTTYADHLEVHARQIERNVAAFVERG